METIIKERIIIIIIKKININKFKKYHLSNTNISS